MRRDRVRYVPSVQCDPPPPTRLPSPVRRQALRRPRVGTVGPPMRLAPTRGRAPLAARAHRRARSAEDLHLLAPTTSSKSTVHPPPLLLGAAGRPRRSAARFHGVRAPPRSPRRLGWLDPSLHLLRRDALRHRRPRRRRRPARPCATVRLTRWRRRPCTACHRPSTGSHRFSVSPPRATCTGASCSLHPVRRYDDGVLIDQSEIPEGAPPSSKRRCRCDLRRRCQRLR